MSNEAKLTRVAKLGERTLDEVLRKFCLVEPDWVYQNIRWFRVRSPENVAMQVRISGRPGSICLHLEAHIQLVPFSPGAEKRDGWMFDFLILYVDGQESRTITAYELDALKEED